MSRPREATRWPPARGLARLEVGERGFALGLRLVAVDRVGVDVVAAQLVRQAVGADAGAGEHQHLLQPAGLDQLGEQLALFLARHRVEHVTDVLRRGVARRDCTSAGLRSIVFTSVRISPGRWPKTGGFGVLSAATR